ncbi:SDR family oxidoreductase [uncultured Sphingomonas sp.]|uniref:SDR family oxidoreductase n=1 Tax=uncultured Sphingomonas sp. TaxID=158754 RepID=UPI0035CB3F2C
MMDKVVAITGASSGIGEAAALRLAERGAKLVLAARGGDRLDALAHRIAAAGGEALPIPVDVSRRDDLVRLVEATCRRFGRLDVLVSSAGAMPIGPLDDLAVDDWERMVDVNLKGVLYGIAAALPVFRAQDSGHFVNIASTAARKTTPNQAVYSATKAAVLALSDGLRQELAGKLRVTVISPGFTNTSFVEHVRDPALQAQMKAAAVTYAMDPQAVASAIAYAIEQPGEINIGEIVVRSTAQP